jgi:hypothetical protein
VNAAAVINEKLGHELPNPKLSNPTVASAPRFQASPNNPVSSGNRSGFLSAPTVRAAYGSLNTIARSIA